MDPLASEDTANAPGAVSDELIQAENEAIEGQANGNPLPYLLLCASITALANPRDQYRPRHDHD